MQASLAAKVGAEAFKVHTVLPNISDNIPTAVGYHWQQVSA
jgi:hypothetical protein